MVTFCKYKIIYNMYKELCGNFWLPKRVLRIFSCPAFLAASAPNISAWDSGSREAIVFANLLGSTTPLIEERSAISASLLVRAASKISGKFFCNFSSWSGLPTLKILSTMSTLGVLSRKAYCCSRRRWWTIIRCYHHCIWSTRGGCIGLIGCSTDQHCIFIPLITRCWRWAQ